MTNEQMIKNMSAQIEQIKQNIENWAKLIQHFCKVQKLEVKDETPNEVKVEINKELCLRCEKPVIDGVPYEEGFYCNSCAGYLEARADNTL
jgi:hypothetical protein